MPDELPRSVGVRSVFALLEGDQIVGRAEILAMCSDPTLRPLQDLHAAKTGASRSCRERRLRRNSGPPPRRCICRFLWSAALLGVVQSSSLSRAVGQIKTFAASWKEQRVLGTESWFLDSAS
jgi:hypothetical protein